MTDEEMFQAVMLQVDIHASNEDEGCSFSYEEKRYAVKVANYLRQKYKVEVKPGTDGKFYVEIDFSKQ